MSFFETNEAQMCLYKFLKSYIDCYIIFLITNKEVIVMKWDRAHKLIKTACKSERK